MSKKKVIIIISVAFITCLISFFGYRLYQYIRIKNAKIEVVLKDKLTLEFNQKAKISDFIVSINGEHILDDKEIDSTKIGKKKMTFSYINDDHIKVSYTFSIEVVDTVKPLIWLNSNYRIAKDSEIVLTDKILCGDNYDSNPKCTIEGQYDAHTVGDYPLLFKAVDSSGNVSEQKFTLTVYEPVTEKNPTTKQDDRIDFKELVRDYKTENNKIGIDVSSWQGDIDFEKIKGAGVEFIMIRVGSKNASSEYFVDKKFVQNVRLANQYHIPVGVYFYSYADSIEEAKNEAKWVLKQIEDYKIELPIAFDWEEWNNFNYYNLSFFELSSMADVFIEEVEKAGYQGLLYSSKNYLENIWFPTNRGIWLAHYTKSTNYTGKYHFWQITSNAKIDGIEGPVDVDLWVS